MRTPTAQRVLATAMEILTADREGHTFSRDLLLWAHFIVSSNRP